MSNGYQYLNCYNIFDVKFMLALDFDVKFMLAQMPFLYGLEVLSIACMRAKHTLCWNHAIGDTMNYVAQHVVVPTVYIVILDN